MRVTQGMLTQSFVYNITATAQRMQQLENELSSGKTLNQPSDNPVAVSQDMSVRADLSTTSGYQSTANAALTWMNNTSGALQEVISALQSVQTVVTSALNGTNQTPAAFAAFSENVAGIQQQVQSVMNTQQGNRYIFGGNTSAPTYNSPLQPGNYSSATGNIQYQIGAAVSDKVTINVNAAEVMATTPTGATANLNNTLTSIVSDLKPGGNVSNLSNDLQNLEANITNVVALNSNVGNRITEVTALQNQLNQYSTTLSNAKGVMEGANMAQVMTQFQTDQTVYTTALKMGSYLLLPSLANYLPNG